MKEFILAFGIYSAGGAIDVASTKYTLSHCVNCYEANAVGGVGIKLGMSAALAGIERTGNKKTKRAMRIGWYAINIGLGAWNLHQGKKYGSK